ncbi:MAG TPA: efflux transporter outer membrane subunit [Steroidobacteraceae bacterium]|jgi:multidrug efflux system outer membrane protein|nr:efflux transporter outer membrane subunit [Steroidobacteraceae bacterium]
MRRLALASLAALLAACTVGPTYRRPAIDTPAAYRDAPAGQAAAARSLGDERWWEVFQDPVLQELIRAALRQNYDVRIAAARVLQAQAELGITRANQFPMVGAGAEAFTERDPRISNTVPSYQANAGEVDLSVIWNLDFWGKYRRETEAARAELLASQWGRRAVLTSVVSSVAAAYFQLRELDLALQLSRSTLSSRQMSLQLTNVLARNGSASMLDVRQSQQLVYTAAETIPDIERQIAQQENALSVLLGNNPGAIGRGRALTEQPNPPTVPAGLPSELLERRPDIRQAEENLIAANAQIGVAKAAYFPDISLTGTAGFESNVLDKLFTGPAGIWNAVGSLTQPVFEAGGLRSGVRLARSQEQQLLLTYRQTVMNAFRQVSDALVAYQKDHEFRQQQELLTAAAGDTDRLSKLLYQHGGVSYLQVLTSETNDFSAELNLAQAQLNERLALVQLYDALGGGWQP